MYNKTLTGTLLDVVLAQTDNDGMALPYLQRRIQITGNYHLARSAILEILFCAHCRRDTLNSSYYSPDWNVRDMPIYGHHYRSVGQHVFGNAVLARVNQERTLVDHVHALDNVVATTPRNFQWQLALGALNGIVLFTDTSKADPRPMAGYTVVDVEHCFNSPDDSPVADLMRLTVKVGDMTVMLENDLWTNVSPILSNWQYLETLMAGNDYTPLLAGLERNTTEPDFTGCGNKVYVEACYQFARSHNLPLVSSIVTNPAPFAKFALGHINDNPQMNFVEMVWEYLRKEDTNGIT